MSLDLYLFASRPGEDPADTFDDLENAADDAKDDPVARERNDRLLDALQARHPEMRRHRSGKTVAFSIVSEWRSVSLVGELLSIYLSREYAAITVDYERAEDRAALAIDAYEAARVIASVTSWQVFDPASEALLSPLADANDYARIFDAALLEEESRPPGLLARIFGRA
jgi:hypothetical protein